VHEIIEEVLLCYQVSVMRKEGAVVTLKVFALQFENVLSFSMGRWQSDFLGGHVSCMGGFWLCAYDTGCNFCAS
jgi:hypothetical protein